MLTKTTRLIAGTSLVVLALGCCWAATPERPAANLLETYRETMAVARECFHRPYCQARHVHEQRLAVEELCYHGPNKCARIEECLKKHMDVVFEMGCSHAPSCPSAPVHYDAVRSDQGLKPIAFP